MLQKLAKNAASNFNGVTIVRNVSVSVVAKSSVFTRVYDRFSGKLAEEAEKADIKLLEEFTVLTKCMSDFAIRESHPINDVAQKIRALKSLDESNAQISGVVLALDNYMAFINAQKEAYELNLNDLQTADSITSEISEADNRTKWQTGMRLRLLGHYLKSLKLAVQEGEIKPNAISPSTMDRMIDSFLLGTSSERIQEHMKLYGKKFNNPQLQDCFYTLYNAEVECVSGVFSQLKNKHKHHKKGMDKYARNYLLDTLELNTKSRCVFAWSDPLFTGFKPLPDDHVIPLDDLLKSRRKYFKEGTDVAHNLMSTYTGERRMYYTEKLDTRDTLRMGFVFFVGTCLLDWLICVM